MADTNDALIQANNFGGLNLLASPVNAPHTDATRLHNVDTNPNGRLNKRKGTYAISSVNANAIYVHSGVTNRGIPFVVRIYNKAISVLTIENGTTTRFFRTFNNVYRLDTLSPTFVALPGDPFRILILEPNHPPVQVAVHEYAAQVSSDLSGAQHVELVGAHEYYVGNVGVYNNAVVYVNSVFDARKPAQFSSYTGVIGPFTAGDTVVAIGISWQWWAESETWWGDNFFKEVPRFNVSAADAVIQVPNTINSDLEQRLVLSNPPAYGIHAHWGNRGGVAVGATVETYVASGKPTEAFQYSFSDGSIYSPSENENDALIPTPFFITFGDEDPRVSRTYFDNDVNPTNDNIRITGHGFRNRSTVWYNAWNSGTMAFVGGRRYVKVLDPNFIELYSDVGLTSLVQLNPSRPTKIFTSGNVDTTNSRITLPDVTNFFNTMECEFSVANGTLPGGITPGTRYYLRVQSGTTIELYFDASLAIQVNITSTGSGSMRVHRVLDQRIYNFPRHRTIFTRIRRFPFLANLSAVDGADVQVRVNDTVLAKNTSMGSNNTGWWHFTSTSITAYAGVGVNGGYYCVANEPNYEGTNFGLSANTRVRVGYRVSSWIGSGASSSEFKLGTVTTYSGGWTHAYGLCRYADYRRGDFPSTGTVFQGRLVLSGFPHRPNLVLFSAIADSAVRGEFYNYFQVTDDLRGDEGDPFDLNLSDTQTGGIVNVYAWQNAVFAFTRNAVYRIQGANTVLTWNNRSVILASQKGAMNARSVAATERNIYYLSQTGMFYIPLVESNEYRAEEVSIKVRPMFEDHNFLNNVSWLCYAPSSFKLYVGLDTAGAGYADRLMVYDVQQDAWSEYGCYRGFRLFNMAVFSERSTEGFPIAGCLDGCIAHILRFESNYYLDFARRFEESVTPLALTRALFRVVITDSVRSTYDIPYYTFLFSNVRDINVWYGTSLVSVALLADTQWEKVPGNKVRLNFFPANGGFLIFTPRSVNSWHGVNVVVNGQIITTTDFFGSIDFTDACFPYEANYTNSVLGVSNGVLSFQDDIGNDYALDIEAEHVAIVGDTYPAEYSSIALTQMYLWTTKRSEYLAAWFRQLNTEINEPDTTDYLSVALGVRYNSSTEGRVREALFTNRYLDPTRDWTLFKESLQNLGYAHQISVWSNDAFAWSLDAWQLKVTMTSTTSNHFSGAS